MKKHFWLLILLFFLVACASQEEKLRTRVEKYWSLRINGQLAEAYKYEYPLFRKKVDLNDYISSRNNPLARYRKAQIVGLSFPEKDMAEVEMAFEIEVSFSHAKKPLVTTVKRKEKWIKIEGTWYHIPAQ